MDKITNRINEFLKFPIGWNYGDGVNQIFFEDHIKNIDKIIEIINKYYKE